MKNEFTLNLTGKAFEEQPFMDDSTATNCKPERNYRPGDTVTDGRGVEYVVGANGGFVRKSPKLSKKKLRHMMREARRR